MSKWFNTGCFTQPPAFTFGNEARVDPVLRMHGINNFDAALFKNTKFGPGEALAVQFRAEFFNLFNHPQFGPPGTTLGNAQFGVVSSQVNNPRLIQFGLKFCSDRAICLREDLSDGLLIAAKGSVASLALRQSVLLIPNDGERLGCRESYRDSPAPALLP